MSSFLVLKLLLIYKWANIEQETEMIIYLKKEEERTGKASTAKTKQNT